MSDRVLVVDPDIRRARTPAPAFYRDAAVWRRVRERVFARSWQWLGPVDDVATPGALSPRALLPGLLDEPLLLACDAGGALRVLGNVCTHRGALLVDAPCRAAALRCPYHARRFDLAGRVLSAPGFDREPGFPAEDDHLPQYPLRRWGPLAFTAIDAPPPFDDVLGPAVERLSFVDWGRLRHDPARDRDFVFDAHWALYVDNYLEGLHIPFVHPGLTRALALPGYRDELYPLATLQLAPARDGEPAFVLPAGHRDAGERIAAYYWWLFPNLMLNFYPWGLSLNVVQPLAPDRTRVQFHAWVGDASRLGVGAGGALDEVEAEDEAVVRRVQRGLASRGFMGGRYSPAHEQGVHHFHRLLAAALAEP